MRRVLHQMRWQIASAYALLILLTLGGLAAALYAATRSAYQRTLEQGVAGQARLVATLAEPVVAQGSDSQLAPFVDGLGRQLRARVTLIDASGHILAAAAGWGWGWRLPATWSSAMAGDRGRERPRPGQHLHHHAAGRRRVNLALNV